MKTPLLQRVLESLEEERRFAPLRFRYTRRNSATGPGRGRSGVRDQTLVDLYGERMSDAAQRLTDDGWPALACEPFVFVMCYGEYLGNEALLAPGHVDRPSVLFSDDGEACVLLPNRFAPSRGDLDVAYAASLAVHETFHLFSGQLRHPEDEASLDWEWLDEAGAVWLERTLVPASPRTDSYVEDWFDLPEASLDLEPENGGGYGAAVFVEAVRRRFGPACLVDLWQMDVGLSAVAALRGYTAARGLPFFSPDPNEEDLFGRLYALPAFQPGDLVPGRHFGTAERALTYSYDLTEAPIGPQADVSLPRLSCRYFRLRSGGRRSIEVTLCSSSEDPEFPGARAELVAFGGTEEAPARVLRRDRDDAGATTRVRLDLPPGADSALLVVSNGTDADAWCRIDAARGM